MSDIARDRLMWTEGHSAMAQRLLNDNRITDPTARAVIEEHWSFTEVALLAIESQAAAVLTEEEEA